jgi:hypothetical protein
MSIGSDKLRASLYLFAVFCVSAALTVGLQWHGNAYRSEWSGDPDESPHYVTGLMLRDYIRSGLHGSPLGYAQRYYEHYPKVAMGHWPPMFYIVQSAWTLLFSPSRASLLLLMAALGALLLTCTYALVRFYFSAWMAWLALILLATSPDFQSGSRSIMAEIPTALFTLAALWTLARYFDQPDLRTAAWFSLASLATVLTKGTGIALAPLPLLDVGLTRRWSLLRTGSFWFPAILAGVPALLWFSLAPDALHQSVALFGGLGARWARIPESLQYWLLVWGIPGALLAALGVFRRARAAVSGAEKSPFWISALVFLPVTVAFRVLLGAWEIRHLLTTLPLLMLFLCDGLAWILSAVPRFRGFAMALAILALGSAAIHNVIAMPAKVHLGIDTAASDLVTSPEYRDARFVIVSDPMGEGVFISEVAAREHRPGHTIERGSKLLAEESFMGNRYRARFTTPAEMMRFFDQGPDRILILDGIPPSPEHVAQVRSMLAQYPNRWILLGRYPRAGTPFPLEIYRLSRTPEQDRLE